MITDLVQIRRLGEQKRPENEKFRRHIKTHAFPERKFRKMAEEIELETDCLSCANCCKQATVAVTERDVEKLARFLRLPAGKFLEEYTQPGEKDGEGIGRDLKFVEGAGCVFLSGNECTVYEARPAICADFPHLVRGKGSIAFRMWQFIDRACYCPIVYNSLEAYKEEVGFRR